MRLAMSGIEVHVNVQHTLLDLPRVVGVVIHVLSERHRDGSIAVEGERRLVSPAVFAHPDCVGGVDYAADVPRSVDGRGCWCRRRAGEGLQNAARREGGRGRKENHHNDSRSVRYHALDLMRSGITAPTRSRARSGSGDPAQAVWVQAVWVQAVCAQEKWTPVERFGKASSTARRTASPEYPLRCR